MQFRTWLNENEGLGRLYIDHPFYGKETVGEFLARHKISVGPDGTFVLYHGMPKTSTHTILRAGTYLTHEVESAKFFAARDRGLDPENDIKVVELKLTADDIHPGIHITLRRDYPLH